MKELLANRVFSTPTPDLKATERLILLTLAYCIGKRWTVYISHQGLADIACISKASTMSALKKLEAKGYVIVTRDKVGTFDTCYYIPATNNYRIDESKISNSPLDFRVD